MRVFQSFHNLKDKIMDFIINNINKLYAVIAIICAALLLRQLLMLNGQNWLRTQSAALSMILLPVITYVITSVISGNIALSLGMVGALSIIRFRNPVKSPLELVTYFLMITIGIAASVSLKWMLLLSLTSAGLIAGASIIASTYFRITKRKLFPNSFAEANSLYTIELSTNEYLEALVSNRLLVSVTKSDSGYTYRLAADTDHELKKLVAWAEGNQLNFSFRAA